MSDDVADRVQQLSGLIVHPFATLLLTLVPFCLPSRDVLCEHWQHTVRITISYSIIAVLL
jgi:hypothetical protein